MTQETQQAPPAGEPPVEQKRLPSTATILARGVTLNQVQQAVRQLRPHIWQAG